MIPHHRGGVYNSFNYVDYHYLRWRPVYSSRLARGRDVYWLAKVGARLYLSVWILLSQPHWAPSVLYNCCGDMRTATKPALNVATTILFESAVGKWRQMQKTG